MVLKALQSTLVWLQSMVGYNHYYYHYYETTLTYFNGRLSGGYTVLATKSISSLLSMSFTKMFTYVLPVLANPLDTDD